MILNTQEKNIVVIGASAGGVEALQALFAELPPDLPAAVLVVLHIPAHTPSELHHILANVTSLRVVVAVDGQALESQTVYVASADRHLLLDEHGIRLTRGPKECRVRPAVDVLFRSAAIYGSRVIGIVLSGTLDDGTAGLWVLKDRGGTAMVQDPLEATYTSMPESAIAHVDVDFVGSVKALAIEIGRRVGTPVHVIAGSHRNTGTGDDEEPELPMEKRHVIENHIAMEGNGIKAGVMELGKVSTYTCPDCHGVLVQIEEGPIVRFRCHTGHAFSLKSLIAEVNAAIDKGLWDTLRAIEERMMLLRQMADLTEHPEEAARCRQQADDAEQRITPLRELVLDPNFFGHDPAG